MSDDIRVKIDKKTIEHLRKLSNFSEPIPFFNVVNESIMTLSKLIDFTQKELKGLFSDNEITLLIDCFNGCIICIDTISPKKLLYAQVFDAINLDRLDIQWNVDGEKLLKKIMNLTEFQAYTVMQTIQQFWAGAIPSIPFK